MNSVSTVTKVSAPQPAAQRVEGVGGVDQRRGAGNPPGNSGAWRPSTRPPSALTGRTGRGLSAAPPSRDAAHARLSHPYLRRAARRRRRDQTARLSGWVHSKRDHGGLLFIDLRDHYGITQMRVRRRLGGLRRRRRGAGRERRHRHRRGGRARARHRQPEAAHRRDRAARRATSWCSRRPTCCRSRSRARSSFPDELRLSYRFLDLRREKLHRNMMLRAEVIASHPPAHDRAGLHRVPDADPDRLQPGRGARLPGAGAAASRQVLRAAAGAAAVQAAADGRRLRPLLPDRALLPRRGEPRRPLAGRVLPARFRDELRRRRRTCSPRSSRCSPACSRSSPSGRAVDAAAVRRASPTTRRCWSTAPTSPICAIRCASPT